MVMTACPPHAKCFWKTKEMKLVVWVFKIKIINCYQVEFDNLAEYVTLGASHHLIQKFIRKQTPIGCPDTYTCEIQEVELLPERNWKESFSSNVEKLIFSLLGRVQCANKKQTLLKGKPTALKSGVQTFQPTYTNKNRLYE